MLHDRKSDTDAARRRAILQRIVETLSRGDPDLYYQPTAQVAREIRRHIATPDALNGDDRMLVGQLSERDIQIILSLH